FNAILVFLSFIGLKAQDSPKINSEYRSANSPALNKKRAIIVGGGFAVTYTSSLLALNQTWYKNYPKTSFHTYNDSGEWLQIDKIGHGWSACNLSSLSTAAWKWAGLS